MDEEIEYLEEYEDLLLPNLSAASSSSKPTPTPTTTTHKRTVPLKSSAIDSDNESSSSLDQDIFESLFDDVSDDDDDLLKKDTDSSKRESLDSIDALVKILGDRVAKNTSARATSEKQQNQINTSTKSSLLPNKTHFPLAVRSVKIDSKDSLRADKTTLKGKETILKTKPVAPLVQRERSRPVATIVRPEKIITKDPAEDPLRLDDILDSNTNMNPTEYDALSDISSNQTYESLEALEREVAESLTLTTTMEVDVFKSVNNSPNFNSTAELIPIKNKLPEKVKILSNTALLPIDKEIIKSISRKESSGIIAKDSAVDLETTLHELHVNDDLIDEFLDAADYNALYNDVASTVEVETQSYEDNNKTNDDFEDLRKTLVGDDDDDDVKLSHSENASNTKELIEEESQLSSQKIIDAIDKLLSPKSSTLEQSKETKLNKTKLNTKQSEKISCDKKINNKKAKDADSIEDTQVKSKKQTCETPTSKVFRVPEKNTEEFKNKSEKAENTPNNPETSSMPSPKKDGRKTAKKLQLSDKDTKSSTILENTQQTVEKNENIKDVKNSTATKEMDKETESNHMSRNKTKNPRYSTQDISPTKSSSSSYKSRGSRESSVSSVCSEKTRGSKKAENKSSNIAEINAKTTQSRSASSESLKTANKNVTQKKEPEQIEKLNTSSNKTGTPKRGTSNQKTPNNQQTKDVTDTPKSSGQNNSNTSSTKAIVQKDNKNPKSETKDETKNSNKVKGKSEKTVESNIPTTSDNINTEDNKKVSLASTKSRKPATSTAIEKEKSTSEKPTTSAKKNLNEPKENQLKKADTNKTEDPSNMKEMSKSCETPKKTGEPKESNETPSKKSTNMQNIKSPSVIPNENEKTQISTPTSKDETKRPQTNVSRDSKSSSLESLKDTEKNKKNIAEDKDKVLPSKRENSSGDLKQVKKNQTPVKSGPKKNTSLTESKKDSSQEQKTTTENEKVPPQVKSESIGEIKNVTKTTNKSINAKNEEKTIVESNKKTASQAKIATDKAKISSPCNNTSKETSQNKSKDNKTNVTADVVNKSENVIEKEKVEAEDKKSTTQTKKVQNLQKEKSTLSPVRKERNIIKENTAIPTVQRENSTATKNAAPQKVIPTNTKQKEVETPKNSKDNKNNVTADVVNKLENVTEKEKVEAEDKKSTTQTKKVQNLQKEKSTLSPVRKERNIIKENTAIPTVQRENSTATKNAAAQKVIPTTTKQKEVETPKISKDNKANVTADVVNKSENVTEKEKVEAEDKKSTTQTKKVQKLQREKSTLSPVRKERNIIREHTAIPTVQRENSTATKNAAPQKVIPTTTKQKEVETPKKDKAAIPDKTPQKDKVAIPDKTPQKDKVDTVSKNTKQLTPQKENARASGLPKDSKETTPQKEKSTVVTDSKVTKDFKVPKAVQQSKKPEEVIPQKEKVATVSKDSKELNQQKDKSSITMEAKDSKELTPQKDKSAPIKDSTPLKDKTITTKQTPTTPLRREKSTVSKEPTNNKKEQVSQNENPTPTKQVQKETPAKEKLSSTNQKLLTTPLKEKSTVIKELTPQKDEVVSKATKESTSQREKSNPTKEITKETAKETAEQEQRPISNQKQDLTKSEQIEETKKSDSLEPKKQVPALRKSLTTKDKVKEIAENNEQPAKEKKNDAESPSNLNQNKELVEKTSAQKLEKIKEQTKEKDKPSVSTDKKKDQTANKEQKESSENLKTTQIGADNSLKEMTEKKLPTQTKDNKKIKKTEGKGDKNEIKSEVNEEKQKDIDIKAAKKVTSEAIESDKIETITTKESVNATEDKAELKNTGMETLAKTRTQRKRVGNDETGRQVDSKKPFKEPEKPITRSQETTASEKIINPSPSKPETITIATSETTISTRSRDVKPKDSTSPTEKPITRSRETTASEKIINPSLLKVEPSTISPSETTISTRSRDVKPKESISSSEKPIVTRSRDTTPTGKSAATPTSSPVTVKEKSTISTRTRVLTPIAKTDSATSIDSLTIEKPTISSRSRPSTPTVKTDSATSIDSSIVEKPTISTRSRVSTPTIIATRSKGATPTNSIVLLTRSKDVTPLDKSGLPNAKDLESNDSKDSTPTLPTAETCKPNSRSPAVEDNSANLKKLKLEESVPKQKNQIEKKPTNANGLLENPTKRTELQIDSVIEKDNTTEQKESTTADPAKPSPEIVTNTPGQNTEERTLINQNRRKQQRGRQRKQTQEKGEQTQINSTANEKDSKLLEEPPTKKPKIDNENNSLNVTASSSAQVKVITSQPSNKIEEFDKSYKSKESLAQKDSSVASNEMNKEKVENVLHCSKTATQKEQEQQQQQEQRQHQLTKRKSEISVLMDSMSKELKDHGVVELIKDEISKLRSPKSLNNTSATSGPTPSTSRNTPAAVSRHTLEITSPPTATATTEVTRKTVRKRKPKLAIPPVNVINTRKKSNTIATKSSPETKMQTDFDKFKTPTRIGVRKRLSDSAKVVQSDKFMQPQKTINNPILKHKLRKLRVRINRNEFRKYATKQGLKLPNAAKENINQSEILLKNADAKIETSPRKYGITNIMTIPTHDRHGAATQAVTTASVTTTETLYKYNDEINTLDYNLPSPNMEDDDIGSEPSLLTPLRSKPAREDIVTVRQPKSKQQISKERSRKILATQSTTSAAPTATKAHSLKSSIGPSEAIAAAVAPLKARSSKEATTITTSKKFNIDPVSTLVPLVPPKIEIEEEFEEEFEETTTTTEIPTSISIPIPITTSTSTSLPILPPSLPIPPPSLTASSRPPPTTPSTVVSASTTHTTTASNSIVSLSSCGGTGVYNFLYPAKYHHSYGEVLLDCCCRDLEGPIPAVNPTRLHSKLEAPIHELPAYVFMTTQLVTQEELKSKKNFIPASVRQKIQRSPLQTQLTPTPKSTTGATVASTLPLMPSTITALKKQLPSTTTIIAKTSSSTTNAQNSEDLVRRVDSMLLKLSHLVLTAPFVERQRVIETLGKRNNYTLKEIETTANLLEDYEQLLKPPTSMPQRPLPTTSSNQPTSIKTINKLPTQQQLQNNLPTKLPQTQSKNPTVQNVPVYDCNKTIIGYQLPIPTKATSSGATMPLQLAGGQSSHSQKLPTTTTQALYSSHTPPTKSTMSTHAAIMSTTSNVVGLATQPKAASTQSTLKLPIQESPRIFYTKPPLQTSTPVSGGDAPASTTPPTTTTSNKKRVRFSNTITSTSNKLMGNSNITIRKIMTKPNLECLNPAQTTTTATKKPRMIAPKPSLTAERSTSLTEKPKFATIIRKTLPPELRKSQISSLTAALTSTSTSATTTQVQRTALTPSTLKQSLPNPVITTAEAITGGSTRKTAATAATTSSTAARTTLRRKTRSLPADTRQIIVVTKDSYGKPLVNYDEECILPDEPSQNNIIKYERQDEDFIGGN